MEPKNYATLRSLLKKEQGEKIASNVFKLENVQSIKKYLDQQRIIYETYQPETNSQTKRANDKLREQLIAGYKASAKSKRLAQEDEIWEEAISDGL
ncbi:MAG: hypothetical protein MRERV_34c005 [Mycoplasmataceae bacterium RV_VA103A]|nr:MAG: hypothetical protein MRERV_34c005 [Mycoplasmataceae bacterium RV_VA103A]